jgi:uncharacterized protein YjeT (DUF2065 family)
MARTNPHARTAPVAPASFLEGLQYFLTPAVWRQAHRALGRHCGRRWRAQPLLLVLLTLTWCWGDSLAERFETARAFYVACYQRRRRPGRTAEGLHKALARVPAPALRAVAAAVRARLRRVFADRLAVDGFIPLGCDGSRLACPRTAELESRLGGAGREHRAPLLWVTALVHLPLGLPWAWRLGKGTASERGHLLRLLATLPRLALLVADAGYVGYEVLAALLAARVAFLIRVGPGAPLYVAERAALNRFREGPVWYWPLWAQRAGQRPLAVRLVRVRGRKADVWLLTSVPEEARLPRATAGKFYRWRWENEGLFRTYKRTLGKVKLAGRTVASAHREAEGSLLAVQLLLAQGAAALPAGGAARPARPSARQVLLAIRAEIRNVTGAYLGPRQRRAYGERLRRAQGDGRRRRRNQVRRPWPGRAEHRPPKGPRVRKMGTDLKGLLAKTLAEQETG